MKSLEAYADGHKYSKVQQEMLETMSLLFISIIEQKKQNLLDQSILENLDKIIEQLYKILVQEPTKQELRIVNLFAQIMTYLDYNPDESALTATQVQKFLDMPLTVSLDSFVEESLIEIKLQIFQNCMRLLMQQDRETILIHILRSDQSDISKHHYKKLLKILIDTGKTNLKPEFRTEVLNLFCRILESADVEKLLEYFEFLEYVTKDILTGEELIQYQHNFGILDSYLKAFELSIQLKQEDIAQNLKVLIVHICQQFDESQKLIDFLTRYKIKDFKTEESMAEISLKSLILESIRMICKEMKDLEQMLLNSTFDDPFLKSLQKIVLRASLTSILSEDLSEFIESYKMLINMPTVTYKRLVRLSPLHDIIKRLKAMQVDKGQPLSTIEINHNKDESCNKCNKEQASRAVYFEALPFFSEFESSTYQEDVQREELSAFICKGCNRVFGQQEEFTHQTAPQNLIVNFNDSASNTSQLSSHGIQTHQLKTWLQLSIPFQTKTFSAAQYKAKSVISVLWRKKRVLGCEFYLFSRDDLNNPESWNLLSDEGSRKIDIVDFFKEKEMFNLRPQSNNQSFQLLLFYERVDTKDDIKPKTQTIDRQLSQIPQYLRDYQKAIQSQINLIRLQESKHLNDLLLESLDFATESGFQDLVDMIFANLMNEKDYQRRIQTLERLTQFCKKNKNMSSALGKQRNLIYLIQSLNDPQVIQVKISSKKLLEQIILISTQLNEGLLNETIGIVCAELYQRNASDQLMLFTYLLIQCLAEMGFARGWEAQIKRMFKSLIDCYESINPVVVTKKLPPLDDLDLENYQEQLDFIKLVMILQQRTSISQKFIISMLLNPMILNKQPKVGGKLLSYCEGNWELSEYFYKKISNLFNTGDDKMFLKRQYLIRDFLFINDEFTSRRREMVFGFPQAHSRHCVRDFRSQKATLGINTITYINERSFRFDTLGYYSLLERLFRTDDEASGFILEIIKEIGSQDIQFIERLHLQPGLTYQFASAKDQIQKLIQLKVEAIQRKMQERPSASDQEIKEMESNREFLRKIQNNNDQYRERFLLSSEDKPSTILQSFCTQNKLCQVEVSQLSYSFISSLPIGSFNLSVPQKKIKTEGFVDALSVKSYLFKMVNEKLEHYIDPRLLEDVNQYRRFPRQGYPLLQIVLKNLTKNKINTKVSVSKVSGELNFLTPMNEISVKLKPLEIKIACIFEKIDMSKPWGDFKLNVRAY